MALFSVSLKHPAHVLAGVFPARSIVFPAPALSLKRRLAPILTFTRNVFPARRIVFPAPALSLKMHLAPILTLTRNVFLARRIAPPVLFSHSYNTSAGGGDDDDDAGHPRPCLLYKGEGSNDCIIGLLAPPASFIRFRGDDADDSSGRSRQVHEGAEQEVVEGAIKYRIEVPGCGREDIKVMVENFELTVFNLKKKESEANRGDDAGLLMMLLVWPYYFKADLIKADVKDGILTVIVPMADEWIDGNQRRTADKLRVEG